MMVVPDVVAVGVVGGAASEANSVSGVGRTTPEQSTAITVTGTAATGGKS